MTKSLLLNLKGTHAEKLEWLTETTEQNQTDVLRKALERYYTSEYRKYEQLLARRAAFQQQIKATKAQVAK